MASTRKQKSGRWRVQVRRTGRALSESFILHDNAKSWAVDTERQNDRGETPTRSRIAKRRSFGDLINLHIADMKEVSRAPRRSKHATLRMLKCERGSRNMMALDNDRLLAFGRERAAIGDGSQTPLMANMSPNPAVDVAATRTRAWRGAEIPAAGGTSNARAVAEIHVMLANGGVAKGRRFMSEAGCRKALELQAEGNDLILGVPVRFGMGFGLPGGVLPLPNPNTLFWGGYGGSLAIIDMDARTTFAYVMNRMAPTTQGDMRAFGLAMAMWEALGN